MVSLKQLQASLTSNQSNASEYHCRVNLNLYDSPICNRLATQVAVGRHLRVVSFHEDTAVELCSCEDDYPGWIPTQDLSCLELAVIPYQPVAVSEVEIRNRISAVIAYTQAAMQKPNSYLWGGNIGPNYDCSGLVQAAFTSVGIWLPRDSYQQEAFTQAIAVEELQPGDLIYFGKAGKTTHVGLHLGEQRYIHSSGIEQGRNGIGVDLLSEHGDQVSRSYYRQLRSCGRVVESYQSQR